MSVILLAATLGACCRIPSTPADVAVGNRPLWVIYLSGKRATGHAAGVVEVNRQIAFGSNDELVVSSDSGPFTKPNTVHAWVLDAKHGSLIGETDWISNFWPYIFATAQGEYSVVTDKGLALYSARLRQIKATAADAADKISPDGRFLAISKTTPGHGIVLLLDSSTLKPTTAKFLDTYAFSVAEGRIAYSAFINGARNASVIVQTVEKRLPHYQTGCREVRPHFVSAETLAVLGCSQVEVISAGGEKLFSTPLGQALAYFVSASRDGRRFAVLQQFERPGDSPSLCRERVTVFDIARRKAVFVVDVTDLEGSSQGASSGAALSPDGSRLAVRSGSVVRLFALPDGA